MSEPTMTAAAPSRPRCHRRWLLLGVPVAIALAVLAFFLLPDPSERELREAIAEADRLDPGWRWEELEARRKAIPDEENAALCVLAVDRLMNSGLHWPPDPPLPPGAPVPDSVNYVPRTIYYLPPPVQLPDSIAREIEESLRSVEPARIEAHKLSGLSVGRYPEPWETAAARQKIALQRSTRVYNLLIREAMHLAQVGQPDDALATGRAILVLARSVGDEPGLAPLEARFNFQRFAIRCLERTLAQGEPRANELRLTQELIENETQQPLLLNGLRGRRADPHRAYEQGYVPLGDPSHQRGVRGIVGGLGVSRRTRVADVQQLRAATAWVEIAKLPDEIQMAHCAELRSGPSPGRDDRGLGVIEDACRFQAYLRCAVVGLALERYRQVTGHWPDRLEELVPAYIKAVPLDPFDGQPVRYERLPDGVVVHSVVPQSRGGVMLRGWGETGAYRETPCAFRLWDPARRRQPAAEVLPMPDTR